MWVKHEIPGWSTSPSKCALPRDETAFWGCGGRENEATPPRVELRTSRAKQAFLICHVPSGVAEPCYTTVPQMSSVIRGRGTPDRTPMCVGYTLIVISDNAGGWGGVEWKVRYAETECTHVKFIPRPSGFEGVGGEELISVKSDGMYSVPYERTPTLPKIDSITYDLLLSMHTTLL